MGHYARGSQRIVPIDECPVHHERGNRIAFALRDRLARARIAPGILRHVVIRTTADGREASAMLVVTRNDKSLRAPVKGLLASPERPDGFFVNIHTKPGPYMVGDETIKIDGPQPRQRSRRRRVVPRLADGVLSDERRRGRNPRQACRRRSSVNRAASSISIAAADSFSLPLAKAGATVTGGRRESPGDRRCGVERPLNRLPPGQIRFIAARVEDALARASKDPWDAVVLDPPRQGCPPAVIAGGVRADSSSPRRLCVVQSRCAREGIAGYSQERLPRQPRAAR